MPPTASISNGFAMPERESSLRRSRSSPGRCGDAFDAFRKSPVVGSNRRPLTSVVGLADPARMAEYVIVLALAALWIALGLYGLATDRPLGPRITLSARQRSQPWPPPPGVERRRATFFLGNGLGFALLLAARFTLPSPSAWALLGAAAIAFACGWTFWLRGRRA
jgi:hypothetical protein